MATATAPTQTARFVLTPETTMAEALLQLQAGKIEPEAFLEWDADNKAKAAARAARSVATLTGEQFLAAARALGIAIGDSQISAKPRMFASGSYGWNYCGKVDVPVAGGSVKVQASINLVVVGSKPAV